MCNTRNHNHSYNIEKDQYSRAVLRLDCLRTPISVLRWDYLYYPSHYYLEAWAQVLENSLSFDLSHNLSQSAQVIDLKSSEQADRVRMQLKLKLRLKYLNSSRGPRTANKMNIL